MGAMNIKDHFSVWLKAVRQSVALNSVLGAASLSYFALLSFFPLILLIVAIASHWFDPLWVESELITRLEFVMPGITQLVGSNLARLVEARSSVTTFASLLLVWSGSTLFSMLSRILDRIWNGTEVRAGIRYRGFALLFVGGLSVIILPLLFILNWITPLASGWFPPSWSLPSPVITLLFPPLVSILLFGLLYRLLPHAGPALQDLWSGAIAAGILWEIAKKGFVAYTANFISGSNLVYGSVSTIIAFLMWVYISALIFFFGANLALEYNLHGKDEHQRQTRRWDD